MNKKYKPIKLEDLAQKLNVSKVTISKALRDHPDISPATTQRVKDLAEKLGYMPNFLARKLSSRKSNTIGLVVPKIAHIFFGAIIEAVYDEAFKHGYETILTVSQEQCEREKIHVLSLLAMRVDGIIVSVTQQTKDVSVFNRVLEQGVPLLFIDRIPNMPNVPTITCDDKGGAYAATEYAIKKGYKKIGFLGGYRYISIGKARYDGFVQAMKDNKVKINENWISEAGFGEDDGYTAFMKMYKSGSLPEYILASTYPIALGMYAAASEVGINIPNDLEVTCFGKNTFIKQIPSVFNFVDQPTRELGQEAVLSMLDQIDNPKEYKKRNIELKTHLVINHGKKTRPIV